MHAKIINSDVLFFLLLTIFIRTVHFKRQEKSTELNSKSADFFTTTLMIIAMVY